jgi:hypothetical protein
MSKDARFRDFDMKPAANLPSEVIGRSAHNYIMVSAGPTYTRRSAFRV